jgi:hypothetical protein
MRILRTGVCALVVLGLAASVSADGPRPLVIVSAEISATGTTLFVSGANFGRSPEVSLGGMALAGVVVNASGTHLTANMPAFQPGSYLLEVSRGYWWEQFLPARLTVAVGASGRQGAEGVKGEKGERGPQGDPGTPGLPGTLVLAGQTCPAGVPLRGFSASGGLVCGLADPTTCGNGLLNSTEEFEPAPGPFASAPVNANTCRFDFSRVTQLFCNGGCSVSGPSGCDQADANLLCKLKTGSSTSVASSFSIELTLAAPGFTCPFEGFGTQVPNMAGRGVQVPVFYSEDSLAAHGDSPFPTSVTNVVCTP